MIGFLEGTVQVATDRYIILDVNGVGYRVTVPGKMMSIIAESGSKVKIFTHFLMNPRDGSVELFGFGRPEELQFFELLTTVSGIGPRSAQTILSSVEPETLQVAIMRGDSDVLSKISGIGPKTAQRLILELKNKMGSIVLSSTAGQYFEAESQAVDALVSLGYSQIQAREALKELGDAVPTVEEKISQALRILGSNKK